MSIALLLLPDFLLIATGWALCRFTPLGRSFWSGAEQLVYCLLFPALLDMAILNNPIRLQAALPLAQSGLVIAAVGVAFAAMPTASS
jgi:predicted permease